MALIVENGSGLADAESYVSVADTDTYHTKHGDPAAWSGSSTANKESALRIATQYLDARYGGRWHGTRINETMALDWPRYGVIDRDGFTVSSSAVPARLEDATAYIALKVREGDTLVPDVDAAGNVTSESKQLGPLSKSVTYAGQKATAPHYPFVDMLLSDLIGAAGTVQRA